MNDANAGLLDALSAPVIVEAFTHGVWVPEHRIKDLFQRDVDDLLTKRGEELCAMIQWQMCALYRGEGKV
jgi:hypothetical protein